MRHSESALVQHQDILSKSCGKFALAEIERAGLADICTKLLESRELSPSEINCLVNHVSPALLAKLVELIGHSYCDVSGVQKVVLRPVVFLPIAQMIEENGAKEALCEVKRKFQLVSKDVKLDCERLYFALDRWNGAFELPCLLDIVAELVAVTDTSYRITPVGPSTAEIRSLIEDLIEDGQTDDSGERYLEKILSDFYSRDISSIEGGGDFAIHKKAVEAGFSVAFGSEVVLRQFSECNVNQSPDVAHQVAFERGFQDGILALRESLISSSKFDIWFPWASQKLDTGNSNIAPLGVQLIRAIALGRLLLPGVSHVRASLALFGIKMAHVALAFGANDLGYAALDSVTEKALGICKFSEATEMISAHKMFNVVID